MVKTFSKTGLIVLTFVVFTQPIFAQSPWVGEYFFDEDGGETVGGSKIYIAHTIKVTEKDGKLEAHIYSQGFQTSRDIVADVVIDGSMMKLLFRKKGPDHVFGDFEKGDVLLSLEIHEKALLTTWHRFVPALDKNSARGLQRFVKQANSQIQWKRIKPEGSSVSVKLPGNYTQNRIAESFYVTDSNTPIRLLEVSNAEFFSGSINGTVFRLEAYTTKQPEKLSNSYQMIAFAGTVRMNKTPVGETEIVSLIKESPLFHRVSWYLVNKEKLYVFTAVNRNGPNDGFEKFFDSIQIQKDYRNPDSIVQLRRRAASNQAPIAVKNILGSKPKIALQIVERVRPSYTRRARRKNTTGRVRLKGTFDRSGLIKNVEVIKTLKNGLEHQAVVALYRFIYLPEFRKNRSINVRKTIEFVFTIY